jgi:hypothetical protein
VTGSTASSVDLSFTDGSGDELGFEVLRASPAGSSTCALASVVATVAPSAGTGGTVAFSDGGVAPSTSYDYWARAFNGGGPSACAGAASVTTPAPPSGISASATGTKVKGLQQVSLTWSPAGAGNVQIYRNGNLLVTTPNDGQHLDAIGVKGSATYVYKICPEGSSSGCSADLTVVF